MLRNLVGGGKWMEWPIMSDKDRRWVTKLPVITADFCRFAVYLFYRHTRIVSEYGLNSIKRLFCSLFEQWPSCL